MKKFRLNFFALKKTLLTSVLFFTIAKMAMTQNTSYNANTIPIGGSFSSAFGLQALSVNTGPYNSAVGYRALFSNTTGERNSATGYLSLFSNTTGNYNTANGYETLYSNTTGNYNTAVGFSAMKNNTTGNFNTAIGRQALFFNTTGLANTASGEGALLNNTTGSSNTATGYFTLFTNTIGANNTATGNQALANNTTGSGNTATGTYALLWDSTGNYNTAVGYGALYSSRSSFSNTAIGFEALRTNVIGKNNTALGDSAGYFSLGDRNIFIGNKAGYAENGSDKLYIGNSPIKTILYGDISTGQLLIGNPVPTGYVFKGNRKLNVLGGILTDSVRVAPSSTWADHVFENDYPLLSLSELEQFIKTNKHLPNIPTANEVAAHGIELGEMNAKLLEKIEELTLYILQQQKQMDAQQKDNKAMKQKLERIEKSIEKLN